MFENKPMEKFIDFFNGGKSSIDSSELLSKIPHNTFGFKILFIHGIELLLKSFIMLKTDSEPPKIHDIKKLYEMCKELDRDNILKEDCLGELISSLSEKFHSDTITARYPDLDKGLTLFPYNSFIIIRECLIKPIEDDKGPEL